VHSLIQQWSAKESTIGARQEKTKEKIGANKTLYYGSSANTCHKHSLPTAAGSPSSAFGKLPAFEDFVSSLRWHEPIAGHFCMLNVEPVGKVKNAVKNGEFKRI
jgi:hypothetical protein